MSLYEKTVLRLARNETPKPQGFSAGTLEPVLHSTDPRDMTPGTVFLWDGGEEVVAFNNQEHIRRAAQIITQSGKSLYFRRDCANVTVVL